MSTTESSGAPAEGSATTPAPAAEFPTFGTTRGSGLARGKRATAATAAASSTPAATDYKPTAIEVVSAPREYTNPFAPAEAPAAEAAPAPAPTAEPPAPSGAAAPAAPVSEEPAQLNILPPAEQRTAPAQTWESAGFTPAHEPRDERAPRDEQPEEVDIASIPPQFLYVREGVKFVPTPKNWGGAPRERRPSAESHSAPKAEPQDRIHSAPAKSGGFLGWLKGLFGGSKTAEPATAGGESRREGGHRRHRGGRSRGGEGGGHRRHRGGRGRSRSHESEGSRQGGSI
jgi:translation initiation factor IF-2